MKKLDLQYLAEQPKVKINEWCHDRLCDQSDDGTKFVTIKYSYNKN